MQTPLIDGLFAHLPQVVRLSRLPEKIQTSPTEEISASQGEKMS